MTIKFTNEIFDRYAVAKDAEITAMTYEFGFDHSASLGEDMYIWAVNHADKAKVMALYEMDENEYAEARELWAEGGAE